MIYSILKRTACIILILLVLTGCSTFETQNSTGATPTVNFITGNFVNGDWSLQIKNNGSLTYAGPGVKVKGNYTLTGEAMEITTKPCGKTKGTYLVHNDGSILTLKAIDDSCADRVAVLSTAMWYASP